MHFLLVGPGALGCLLSYIVSCGKASDDQLTILDYNGDRADYISRNGIVYRYQDDERRLPVNAVSDPEVIDAVDVVLLCVKSYHLRDSIDFCRVLLTERALLIFLQNGISHLTPESHLFHETAAYGTTTEGATLLDRGHVHHTGRGTTHLGFQVPPAGRFIDLLEKTSHALHAGGLQVEITSDIITKLWAKLFVNAGINALSAILDCKNGELLTRAGIPDRMQRAVDEAVQVAVAYNIPVPADPWKTVQTVCMNTAENISSMVQDVRHKRRTEIDAINGAVAFLGKRRSVATPENSTLHEQIRALETAYSPQ